MKGRLLSLVLAALLAPALLGADVRGARKTFLRARVAVAEGRFREALDLYRRVLAEMPDDAVVHYEYAQLLRDLNVTDEAIEQAREAVRLDPSLPEARRLLGALELAGAGKDSARLDRAIAQLQEAHKLSPSDPATSATLARALLARGRPGDAARVLDEMPEAHMQPGLMRLAAEAQAKSGRAKEAEALYQELLEADPADREIAAALVDLYEDEDRFEDALRLLQDLEKKDPENAGVSERIAIDLARAGRFDEAEKRARSLAGKQPENRDVRRLLAQVLFEKGDAAAGEKILRDLLATDADDEGSRKALVESVVRERRFTDARGLLETARKKGSPDAGARTAEPWPTVELGFIALLEKNYPEAKKTLEPLALAVSAGTVSAGTASGGSPSAGTVSPGTVSAGSARATRILLGIARETEDFAYGLARAQAAAAADPSSAEWEAAVAEFRQRSGERARAEETLSKLAASTDVERVLAAADVYARLKDYPSAARVAKDAVRRFPESTEALFRLGSSLERGGQIPESEKTFQKLLSLRPHDAQTMNYLGYMWADRGVRLEEARELLEKAVAREPRNGAFRDSLGWVYFRLGRLEAAEKNLREAHRTDPEDATIEEHLGDLAEKQGNLARAVEHWERALTLKPEEPEKIRQKVQKQRTQSSGKK
jgi:tetratricopeptide (TPR) repeat protein